MSNQNIKLQCLDNNDELFVIDSVAGILNSHTGPSTNSSTGSMVLHGGLSIMCTEDSTSSSHGGALTIRGGLSVGGKLFVKDALGFDNVYYTNTTINSLVTNDVNLGVASFFSGSATGLNNVSTPTNISGLVFQNANIRSFTITMTINMNRTSGGNLFENFILEGIQNDSGWTLLSTSQGDITGIVFSITSSGQIQYTGTNMTNWSSTTFRYFVTQISTNGSYQTLLSSLTTGNLLFQNIQITDTTDAINGLSTGGFNTLGGASIEKSLVVKSLVDSTSKTEGGSLTVLGGGSISKTLLVGEKIGIGTTAPVFTLDVNGTLEVSNTNGVMLFNSSGNVGIGTTSPARKLTINGTASDYANGPHIDHYTSSDGPTFQNLVWTKDNITLGFDYYYDSGSNNFKTNTTSGYQIRKVFNQLRFGYGIGSTGSIVTPIIPMVIGSTGNIGIGTTSPTATLNVDGNFNATGSLHTLGSLYVSGGHVGINNISMGNVLDVRGPSAGANAYIGIGDNIAASFGARVLIGYNVSTAGNITNNIVAAQIATDTGGNMYISSRTNYPSGIRLYTNDVATAIERMRITNTGNVGIGTTAPVFTLDVNGTLEVGNTNGVMLFNSGGNVGIGTTSPAATLDANGTVLSMNQSGWSTLAATSTASDRSATVMFTPTNTVTTANPQWFVGERYSANGPLSIWKYDGSTHQNNYVTIGTGGNVGIGTTSPSSTLHVNGDAKISSMQFTQLGNYSRLNWVCGNSNSHLFGVWSGGLSDATYLAFNAYSAATDGSTWTVGNTGIATTSIKLNRSAIAFYGSTANGAAPTHLLLNISNLGPITAYNTVTITGGGLSATFNSNTVGSIITTGGNVGIGTASPAYQLQLSSDSAAKPSTNTWTISSDARLKTNITNANLDICYDNVKNIPLKRYTWLDEVYTEEQVPDRSKLGWIAQDVETYLPKSVEQKEMFGYSDCRTLNSDQIIANMYGALQKVITDLETEREQHILTKELLYNLIEFIKSKYPSEF
jgi:hypothetical protein